MDRDYEPEDIITRAELEAYDLYMWDADLDAHVLRESETWPEKEAVAWARWLVAGFDRRQTA